MLVVADSSYPSRRLKLIAAILHYLKHAVGRYERHPKHWLHVLQYAHKLFDLRLRLTSRSYTPDSFVDCALLTVFTSADSVSVLPDTIQFLFASNPTSYFDD